MEESRRKEHQGGRGSSSLDPPFLVEGGPCGGPLFFSAWPAALYLTPVTARPPAGRAGRGGFVDGKGSTAPKPSPRGEGAPVRTLGRMRGRFGTQPFLVEKGRSTGRRLNEVFLLPRWATRSPPHQSPPVTASPQGEASGLCYPTRKKRSKSGHADGHRNSPSIGTMRHNRQNERVGTSGL